jgi:hypothetical protein
MSAVENWMALNFTRYVGSLDRRPAATLAEMRHALRGKADEFRASFRSRAGRLWAAQQLDATLGKLIVDDLDSGSVPCQTLFNAVESLKARSLLDQMSGRFKSPDGAIRSALAEAEREVMRFAPGVAHDPKDQLIFNEMLIASRLPLGSLWDRSERRDALDRLEQRYADADAGFEGVEGIVDLAELQQALDPGELLLEYFIPYHPLHPAIGLLVLAVGRDWCDMRRFDFSKTAEGFIGSLIADGGQPLDASPLGAAVTDARTHIQRGDDAGAIPALVYLHNLLMWHSTKTSLAARKSTMSSWCRTASCTPCRSLHSRSIRNAT